MKKILSFLFLVLILSSCSNWKYGGKVRPSGNEVRYAEVVIEKDKVEPLVFNIENETNQDLALAELPAKKDRSTKIENQSTEEISKESTEETAWIPYQDKVVENEDSLKIQDEILAQALQTDKEAKKGLIFSIIGIATSWTPAFIVGLIFSINGIKRSSRALKAQYITPKGLKNAKTGLILSIIGLVISSIILLTIMLVLLILVIGF